jgi:hypothetical protein
LGRDSQWPPVGQKKKRLAFTVAKETIRSRSGLELSSSAAVARYTFGDVEFTPLTQERKITFNKALLVWIKLTTALCGKLYLTFSGTFK